MAATVPQLRTYRVVLQWDDEGKAWNVSVPALPGCFTFGETVREAMERAHEAIEAHVAGLLKDGEPIPLPDAMAPMATVLVPS